LTDKNGSATNINYYDYISEATGIEIVNMGRSGKGYARGDYNKGSDGTVTEQGLAFYQTISEIKNKGDIDVITIFGSGNDLGAIKADGSAKSLGTATDTGTDTICGCINTTLDNLFTALPLANVALVTPTPWGSSDLKNENSAWTKYCAAIVEIARIRGIPSLDLYHCSGLRPWDDSHIEPAGTTEHRLPYTGNDTTHPNEVGHAMIAPRFKALLESMLL
jgi:lysophospholipase L1-like esterase